MEIDTSIIYGHSVDLNDTHELPCHTTHYLMTRDMNILRFVGAALYIK